MIESAVLTALKDKRARLAYDLKEAELRVVALRTDLASVDNCLRIFGSDIDPETIRAKITQGKSPANLPKGAGTRTALEILRETGQPMSTPELAACILQRFGKPLEERSLSLLVKTIQGNFTRRSDGIVEFVRDSYPGKWRLVTPLLGSRK
ncbi:MAG TPA: hypothetical protein VHU23_18250 [Rhizomicrobium sp.]|nr:hypothetical protein [Rhizomicrobium sp.]